MYHITLSKEIKQNCPEFRGAAVFAEVTNTPYCEGVWQEIATFTQELRARRFYQATDFHNTDGRHQTSTRYLCYP